MSIQDRVEDADCSGRTKRREEALLSVLVAVAATARKTFPQITGDQAKLEAFMKTRTTGPSVSSTEDTSRPRATHFTDGFGANSSTPHRKAASRSPHSRRIQRSELLLRPGRGARTHRAAEPGLVPLPHARRSARPTLTSPRWTSRPRGLAAHEGSEDADLSSFDSTRRAFSQVVSGGRPCISVWRRMYSSSEGRSFSHGHSESRG